MLLRVLHNGRPRAAGDEGPFQQFPPHYYYYYYLDIYKQTSVRPVQNWTGQTAMKVCKIDLKKMQASHGRETNRLLL